MPKTRVTYLLHHGAPGNSYYALYVSPPRVRVQQVSDGHDPTLKVPLYESPDEPVFNFCRFGFEQRLKIRLPLGHYLRLELTPGLVDQPEPIHVTTEGDSTMSKQQLTAEAGLASIKDVAHKLHAAPSLEEGVKVGLAETIAKLQAAVDMGATGQDIVDQLKVVDASKVAKNLAANT